MRCASRPVLLLLFGLLAVPAQAQYTDANGWSTMFMRQGVQGQVFVAKKGPDGHYYVGGRFASINGVPGTENIARWNTTTNMWEAFNQGVSGDVYDLDFLTNGDLVIVGQLGLVYYAGNTWFRAGNMARWDQAGGRWRSVGQETTGFNQWGTNAKINAVAIDANDQIYIGGSFTDARINGVAITASRLARFDYPNQAWHAFGAGATATDNGTNSEVTSLLFDTDGSLLFGGRFTEAYTAAEASLPLNHLGRWTPSTTTLSALGDASSATRNGISGIVWHLDRTATGTVYVDANGPVTGYNADGSTVNLSNVGAWTSGTWTPLGSGIDQNTGFFLDTNDDLLAVGGSAGGGGNGFARWNAGSSTWSAALPGSAGLVPRDMQNLIAPGGGFADGNDLIVFGAFVTGLQPDGSSIWADHLLRWDDSANAWSSLGSASHNGLEVTQDFSQGAAMLADGDYLYVAAYAEYAGTTRIANFGRYDRVNQQWESLGAINSTPRIESMAKWGNRVVITGDFDSVTHRVGGTDQVLSAQNIVAWNLTTNQFEAFGDGSSSIRNGLDARVNDVAPLPNGDLVAVGNFRNARQSDGSTLPTNRMAIWDAANTQWRTLTGLTDGNNGVSDELYVVAIDASGHIVVAGRKGNLINPDGSQTAYGRVARWTGSAWALYGSDSNNNAVDGTSTADFVNTLAVVGNDLYIGGRFRKLEWTSGGSVTTNDVGRWDGSQWHAVGNLPQNTNVHVLTPYGGDLFASAYYSGPIARIYYFDGTSWSNVGGDVIRGNNTDLSSNPKVNDLAIAGGALYAVGDFSQIGNVGASMLAAYPNLQPPNSLASPIVTAPTDGATGLAINPTVTWQATPFAATYDLQISTNADYSSPVVDQTGLTGTSYDVAGLSPNTLYYLRLRSRNGGTASTWTTLSFRTTATALPPAPVLAEPADAATSMPLRPTFRWNPADQAFLYQIQVATDNGFTNIVEDTAALGDTSHTPATNVLPVNTTGFWRVRGINNLGLGPWSSVFSFTTAEADLPISQLTSPADGATNQGAGFLTFQWTNSAQRPVNELQVFDVIDMTTPVVTELVPVWFSSFYRKLASELSLTTGTTYRWRTRALDTDNPGPPLGGPWSEFFTFTTSGTHPDVPVAPVLATPTHQATGLLFLPTLTWNASANATSYEVQVSKSSSSGSFEHPSNLVETQEVANLSHTLTTTLAGSTNYYWRVRAKNVRGTSAWSTIWRFTTAAFGPPILLSPADASTAHPVIDHTLGWQAFDAANRYQLQVSTDPTFAAVTESRTVFVNESDPADTSTPRTATLSTVLTRGTTYYWRIQARRGSTWGAWSQPWSFTTTIDPAPTEVVTLIWPDEGNSSGLYFQGTWIPSITYTRYQVQVGPDPDFDEEQSRFFTANRPQIWDDFYQSGSHHWRVRVVGPTGYGPWSASRVFTAGGSPNLPPVPSLHGERSVTTAGHVTVYNQVSGVISTSITGCTYDIATDAAFTNIVLTQAVAGSGEQMLPLSGLSLETVYYVRSRCDVSGTPSLYSPTGWFSTGDGVPDAPPVLLTPADAATSVSTYPTYTWQPAVEAAQYRIQVSTDAGFGTTVLDHTTTGAPTSYLTTTSLAAFTTYHWRVMALGAQGNSAWSTAWSFQTGQLSPATPILTFPTNGAVDMLTGITFTWNDIAGANRIQIQIKSSGQDWEEPHTNFTSSVSNPLPLSFTTNTLNINTTYEWRVRGLVGNPITATGNWSEVWTFTTYDPPPPATPPTLLTPTNSATDVSTNPTFTWSAVTNATQYHIQISTSSTFRGKPINRYVNNVTTLDYTGLNTSQVYYWRARALNPAGQSAYSDAFSFTTNDVAAPRSTYFSYRFNGDVIAQNPRIWWTSSVGATTYDFQLATDDGFSNRIVDETGLTGLWHDVSGLTPNTTYHARVRALGPGGTTTWTTVSWITYPYASAERSITNATLDPFTFPGVNGMTVDFSFVEGAGFHLAGTYAPVLPENSELPEGQDYAFPAYWTIDLRGPFADFGTDVCFDLGAIPAAAYNTLVVYKRGNSFQTWQAQTTALRPEGAPTQVCARNVSSFSQFIVTGDASALPVELASFDARRDGEVVQLLWTTASETNNAGFEVQRLGEDGTTWNTRGWMDGAGTTVEAQAYTFTEADFPYLMQTARYRLKQVDYDGTFAYSPEVEIALDLPSEVALEPNYPNPFNPTTTIRYALPRTSHVTLTVYDGLGRIVRQLWSGPQEAGRYALPFDAQDLASGTYFYRLRTDDTVVTRRMTLLK